MTTYINANCLRASRTPSEKSPLTLALMGVCSVLWLPPAQALQFNFANGVTGSFDSTLSLGISQRLESADCQILGGDNGGCNNGVSTQLGDYYNLAKGNGYVNADINYSNADAGDANYKKHAVYSEVVKGTHELSLKYGDGWSALARGYWVADSKMSDTANTNLRDEAREEADHRIDLLDLWIAKSFDLMDMPTKIKVGNQVISWGEELFIQGGINQINALNLTNYHTPGTQLKEVFTPAPMVSFNLDLTDTIALEAFYQAHWNAYQLDPAGTYFSTVNIAGTGNLPIYYSTKYIDNFYGAGFCAATTPTGQCGAPNISGLSNTQLINAGLAIPYDGERRPKNSGQYGAAVHWQVEQLDADIGFYYERYHDKLPFVGYTALNAPGSLVVDNYVLNYGEDKNLFGLSLSTLVGPVAVAGEVSYRPNDSVAIDPTVAFGARGGSDLGLGGGAYNPNSVFDTGTNKGYVEEKKWQANLNTIYTFSANDPLGFIPKRLGASGAYLLVEAAVVHYPDLDTSGFTPYVLPDYSLPDKTSWGYVAEFGLTYPNLFNTGLTVTPQLDYSQDVHGTTPNGLPFVEGRQALTTSLLVSDNDALKGSLQWVQYWGGSGNNLIQDRDFVSASISYSF
jgi:hypothetical protein